MRLLVLGVLGWAASQMSAASMYEVSGDLGAAVFRDATQPMRFYFVPRTYQIAQRGGSPALGIQYSKSSEGQWSLHVTASVVATMSQGQATTLQEQIRQRFASPTATFAVAPRTEMRVSLYRASDPTDPVGATQWSAASLDATLTLTASIANLSRGDLGAILHGKDDGLVVLVEILLDGVVDGVASASLDGQKLHSLVSATPTLEPGVSFENFVRSIVSSTLIAQQGEKPQLTGAVRDWVTQQLGPPALLRADNRFAYGWLPGRSQLSSSEQKSFAVVLGTPHKARNGSIIEMRDACATYRSAIVNIDSGVSGCADLR